MAPYCPQCGVENPDSARFCDQCGAALIPVPAATPPPAATAPPPVAAQPTTCPQCGTAVIPGEAFCDNCGAALLSRPPVAGTAGSAPQPPFSGAPPQPTYPAPQPVGSPPPQPAAPQLAPVAQRSTRNSLAPARLVVLGSAAVINLPPTPQAVVGRADEASNFMPDIDLTAHDALTHGISRRHLCLAVQGDALTAEDLDSINGSFVNGQRLTPRTPHVLRDNDELRLGKLVMRVYL